jgi:hypothetical protein
MEKLNQLHHGNMKKNITLILLLLLSVSGFAQKRLAGIYYGGQFTPSDTNIIVKAFYPNRLIPFMIKGKDPFIAKSNKVGYIDTVGNIVIKPAYINASEFKNGYAFVARAGEGHQFKLGLINARGKIIIPINYNMISECDNSLFMVRKDTSISFINKKGDVIVPLGKYTAFAAPHPIYVEGNDMNEYSQRFNWDMLNFNNYVRFDKYIGVRTHKKWAVIDKTGKEVIPPLFDGIEIFKGDYAPAELGTKFGVTDIKGNMIIPALYDQIILTGKNFVYAVNGKKMGVLSIDNKILIPVQYTQIDTFGEGFTAIDFNKKATLFDADGKQVSKPMDDPTIDFPVWGRDGFFVYNSTDKKYHTYKKISENEYRDGAPRRILYYNNGWGLLDTMGREITHTQFDEFDTYKLLGLNYHNDNLIAVKENDKWGVITEKGTTILNPEYDEVVQNEGRLIVKKNGKYGFFDNSLKQLTAIKYDSLVTTHLVGLYHNNGNNDSVIFMRARIGKKWGLVSSKGRVVIPFKYDEVVWIYYKLALVKNDGKYGVVNFQGEQTIECLYDEIRCFDPAGSVSYYNGNLVVKKNNLYGLVNPYGALVAPAIYEKIIPLFVSPMGKYQVTYHNKLGVLEGMYGKIIIPCEYDDLKFYNSDGADTYNRNWHSEYSTFIIAFKEGSCGLIDSVGKVRLPIIYSEISFQENVYFVVISGQQGIVDKNMKVVVPPKYNYISIEPKGIYVVHLGDYLGLINKDGFIIADVIYTYYQRCGDLFILRKDKKFGTINLQGKVVDSFIYHGIECRYEKPFKLLDKQ